MTKHEEQIHTTATDKLLTAAAAFKAASEHTGHHLQFGGVLDGFTRSVADLQASALAFQRFYADELAKTAPSSLDTQPQLQQAHNSMLQAAEHLKKAAAALETAKHEGESLIGHAGN